MRTLRTIPTAGIVLFLCLLPAMPAQAAPLPADVQTFINRRNDCDHFRGEDSPDAERRAEIDKELKRLCTGSDSELARLMRRYAKNKAVQDALGDYDPDIESNDKAE